MIQDHHQSIMQITKAIISLFVISIPLVGAVPKISKTELLIQWNTKTYLTQANKNLQSPQKKLSTLPSPLQQRQIKHRKILSTKKQLSKRSPFRTTQPRSTPLPDWELITFQTPQNDILELVEKLSKHPSILNVQPNYGYALPKKPSNILRKIQLQPQNTTQPKFTPNDPLFNEQTQYVHTKSSEGWHITQGDSNCVIAVIDTGMDLNHPDFIENAWINTQEIIGNNIDDDQNGYIDDIIGWDFAKDDNLPEDIHGHGTHVAGIVAADSHNNIGITGTGFNTKVMILKAAHSGPFYSSDIAQALHYAIRNKADIVNMSFGGLSSSGDPLIENAVISANNNGLLLIAAAGNSSQDIADAQEVENGITYTGEIIPANYPEVLTVSAANSIGIFDTRYSNYGSNVNLIAQGTYVLSLALTENEPEHPYVEDHGTSMAAPHIAGLAGLLKCAKPSISSTNLYTALTQTAEDKGDTGRDPQNGFGMPNIHKALQFLDQTPPSLQHTPPNLTDFGLATTIMLTASDDIQSPTYPIITINYQHIYPTRNSSVIQKKMNRSDSTYSFTLPKQETTQTINYYFEGIDSISTHNTRLPSDENTTFTLSIKDISGPKIQFLQPDSTTSIENNDFFSPTQNIDIQFNDYSEILFNSLQVTINNTLHTLNHAALTQLDDKIRIQLNISPTSNENLSIQVSIKDNAQNQNSKSLLLKPSTSDNFIILGADGQKGLYNTPNPFNPDNESTQIGFQLNQNSRINCTIYTLQLDRIKSLEETFPPGYHTLTWDGTDENGKKVPNGVYPVLMKARGKTGSSQQYFKIIILR